MIDPKEIPYGPRPCQHAGTLRPSPKGPDWMMVKCKHCGEVLEWQAPEGKRKRGK